MDLFENVIWEFWTLGVMALLKNGFFCLSSYGSNEPWELWVLGVLNPFIFLSFGSYGPWELWAMGTLGLFENVNWE